MPFAIKWHHLDCKGDVAYQKANETIPWGQSVYAPQGLDKGERKNPWKYNLNNVLIYLESIKMT